VTDEVAVGTRPHLAFDFGGTKIDIALVGPGPVPFARVTLDTRPEAGADAAVARALQAGADLLRAEGIGEPGAVGVSTMGYTREDGVHLAPNVPGWESLRLPGIFRAAFPSTPIAIDNDVRAAASAELRWGALAGVATGLYVNFGTGVAASVVIQDRIVTGAHGVAGEVGAWVVPSLASDAEISTLEVEVGGAGVRRRAEAIGIDGGFAELVASPAEVARTLTRSIVAQVAASVTNMAILVDPDRVVLGGGYTRSAHILVGAIEGALRRSAPVPPEVIVGRFGAEAGLYGAMALAQEAASR
jgi:glucokinase